MGIAERKIRQKEEVRLAILNASWSIVEKEGWQALSIRKIAEAIEYSVPVIYDHFANKEMILLEFTRRGFSLLNSGLKDAGASFYDPALKLEAIGLAYWRFARENKEYYQLMYGLGMPTCETVKQIDELSEFSDLIMRPIKELLDAGRHAGTDPFMKLHTFWSMIHGLISINMMGKDNNTGDEKNLMILKDFMGSFIAGLK
ncbi:MAG: TetR/AcrR family transcriptional regulator [Flavitalea sp.]